MKKTTALQSLQDATSRAEIAAILGSTLSGMNQIIYETQNKYSVFEIPKKHGGVRRIKAPIPRLKLFQSRLAKLLYAYVEHLKERDEPGTNSKINFMRVSHGFQKNRGIISNASQHCRRRYVFNVDIKDFFDAINFGRVRGFFIKDRRFQFHEKVATAIAQIACDENALPQGSPSSPIISNLVGNILDKRLSKLARDHKCTYTRYADDLTFSTNMRAFPEAIAINQDSHLEIGGAPEEGAPSGNWVVGNLLRHEIESAGFKINESKTRMTLRCSRQEVTGLVVNKKPNINQSYYRNVRAMCNNLFQKGTYYLPEFAYLPADDSSSTADKAAEEEKAETTLNLQKIEGMLSHIYFVKMRRDRRDAKNTEKSKINDRAEKEREFRPPSGSAKLYKRFLQYKHFMAPEAPLIVTEGPTDIIYLKCAIRQTKILTKPIVDKNGKRGIQRTVNFLKRSGSIIETLDIPRGGSGQSKLIGNYAAMSRTFRHKPMLHPVIILCDNDQANKSIFSHIKDLTGLDVKITSTEPFYHLMSNLYVVKVPQNSKQGWIEGLFDDAILSTKIGERCFELIKNNKDDPTYDKMTFARRIIMKDRDKISFGEFSPLLQNIQSCIEHYEGAKNREESDQAQRAAAS